MQNILDNALGIHRDRLNDAAGSTCTYIQSRYRILNVRCVLGSSDGAEMVNDYDGYTELKVVDFLLNPDDMVLGGEKIIPRRGDQIEYNGEVFDILPGNNSTMWRWSDSRKTWYRVHTDFRRVRP